MTDHARPFRHLTEAEALRALYVDFEGEKDRPPVLLGVHRRGLNGKGDGPVRRGICNRPDPPQLARVEHLGHSDWIYQGAGARCERDRRGAPRLDL